MSLGILTLDIWSVEEAEGKMSAERMPNDHRITSIASLQLEVQDGAGDGMRFKLDVRSISWFRFDSAFFPYQKMIQLLSCESG